MDHQNIRQKYLEIYDKYADAIFRYCFFKTSDRQTAFDISQETFMKLWEYMISGKQIENIKAFMYRVAGNTIIDNYRKKKSISLEMILDKGFDARSETDTKLEMEKISDGEQAMRLLRTMEDKYCKVLMFRFVDDLSIKEIAQVLGETENNISVRISRGLDKLKKLLIQNG